MISVSDGSGFTMRMSPARHKVDTRPENVCKPLFGGADSLTRTDDLSLTRRLLYQLSYAGSRMDCNVT